MFGQRYIREACAKTSKMMNNTTAKNDKKKKERQERCFFYLRKAGRSVGSVLSFGLIIFVFLLAIVASPLRITCVNLDVESSTN